MINQLIHRQVEAIDSARHRGTRLRVQQADWSFASGINSIFVTATEFGDACREYPVVFINAGKDEAGKMLVAPVAVLGMSNNENLFVNGTAWRARYIPAVLRSYPFCTARVDNERFAVCIDAAFPGVSQTEGEALFTAEGKPTPFLENAQKQLEVLETETQRTRLMCQKLVDMDLLRDMRFDATFPDGRKHSVDGFFAVDQERAGAMTDAQALDLHKTGVMGLIHAHWISLGNMRSLLDMHVARHPAPAPVAAPANA